MITFLVLFMFKIRFFSFDDLSYFTILRNFFGVFFALEVIESGGMSQQG